MQELLWASVLFWAIGAGAIILVVMGPRRAYWKLEARFKRHPEALEPSTTGYEVRQFFTVVLAVVNVGAGIFFLSARSAAQYESADQLHFDVADAAEELSGAPDDGFGMPTADEVERAVFDAGDDGQLEVVEAGEGEYSERYEIRTKDGNVAVCLVVQTSRRVSEPGDGEITATADKEPCVK